MSIIPEKFKSSFSILAKIKEKEVTPQEFNDLYKNKRHTIESVRIEAPKLGTQGFGKFWVILK